MSDDGKSMFEVMRGAMGDHRTDDECGRDGARATISQIDKLRRQLDQAERAAQYVIRTGKMLKEDAAIWRRVAKASDKLLDGLVR